MKKALKILLLEDSADDAMLIDRELKKGGLVFTLRIVSNKCEFETALKNDQPDIILCDHSLPDYNSIEAFDFFKKHQKAVDVLIPFILVTGNISEEFSVQSIKSGIDDYILKDRLKRLPLAIKSALEKGKIENERMAYLQLVIAEKELMNEAEQLGHFGSWQVDLCTGKHRWSDATFCIYGFKPGEIEPDDQTFLSLVHPDDRAYIQAALEHTLEQTNEAEYEFRIIDNQGKTKYLNCKLKVHRNADGKRVRMVGFNLDISERMKVVKDLKKSEQEFRSLFHENPDAVFSLDVLGKFTNVNKAFIDMVGYSREEMLGTDFRKILVKSELEKVYKHFLSALERKPQRYETTFINKLRKSFTLDVTLMAIAVDDEIIGAHCVAKDITEKKKVETLLDQAYRTARIGGWEYDFNSKKLNWTGITRELHEVPDAYEPTTETALSFYKEGRSREMITHAVQNCLDHDVPWDLELQIITFKGNHRWMRTIGQGVREGGICVRLYGTFQDIHERKAAERSSRRSWKGN
jgi:PAS domain S-box-containing protein